MRIIGNVTMFLYLFLELWWGLIFLLEDFLRLPLPKIKLKIQVWIPSLEELFCFWSFFLNWVVKKAKHSVPGCFIFSLLIDLFEINLFKFLSFLVLLDYIADKISLSTYIYKFDFLGSSSLEFSLYKLNNLKLFDLFQDLCITTVHSWTFSFLKHQFCFLWLISRI